MPKLPRYRAEEAAVWVASGRSAVAFGKAHGLSDRSAQKLFTRPDVLARAAAIRGQATTAAVAQLNDALGPAVDRLRELSASANEAIALGAARSVVALFTTLDEHAVLRRRLDELERANEKQERQPWA